MKEIRKSFWFCHVIDKKKNYLWNYNLNVEAINYNILRIVSGSGAIVYSG